jgi:hypothetical protein
MFTSIDIHVHIHAGDKGKTSKPGHGGDAVAEMDQCRMLFGRDFAVLTPDRWLGKFAALDNRTSVRPKIMPCNAAKFLGITVPAMVSVEC